MEFRALGPLEVADDGRELRLGGPKQRTVLARLLLDGNRVVAADALIEQVWGHQPPEHARATLQVYVANLRKLLGHHRAAQPRLVRQSPGYLLRVDDDELDVDRFGRLVELGRSALHHGDPHGARTLLAEALALWRGPAFPDLTCGSLSPPEVPALEEQRLSALEDRLDADLGAGMGADLVAELDPLIATYPLRERLHAQRLVALYRAGRQAEALEAYRAVRELLLDELGVDPGPELRRLEAAVLHQDPTLDAPVATSLDKPSLPVAATAMIGRENEIAELGALLRDPNIRMVSLLGPGGTGKSRLALEVATEVQLDFPDGACFVSLAPVTDHRLVLPTIASALGVQQAGGSLLEVVRHHLAGRRTLLVLDNFEHVLQAAGQVAELLAFAAHLTVVTTSRAPLWIRAEHEYLVPPLRLPELDPLPPLTQLLENEAVRLFTERARAVTFDFALAEDDAPAVAMICHRLDGLPLALELAAARVRVLRPEEILTRLDARLNLLTGGARDLPTRQQTLRATIAWSCDLLEPEDRALFTRLAVFSGGSPLAAIETVCAPDDGHRVDLLDNVDRLVAQSLIRREQSAGGVTRFEMLQTIHEYATELLAADPDARAVRRRHAEYHMAHAQAAAPGLEGGRQLDSMTTLSTERDNLRASLAWSTTADGDHEISLRIAGALWHFWEMTGALGEGRHWLETVLEQSNAAKPELLVAIYTGAGTLAFAQGDYDQAAQLHEQALDLARHVGDRSAEAFALNNLATQLLEQHQEAQAESLFEQAAALAASVGNKRVGGMAVHNVGLLAFLREDYRRAAQSYEDALRLLRPTDDSWLVAGALRNFAVCTLRLGNVDDARAALRESLDLATRLGGNRWLIEGLEGLATVAEQSDQPTKAVRLLAVAARLRRNVGAPLEAAEQPVHDALIAALHAKLTGDKFNQAWDEGQRLTPDEAVEQASET